MKTKNLLIEICLLFVAVSLTAQTPDGFRIPERGSNNQQPLDINSKANELGLSADQLQAILNSAANNGGGEPLPDAMQERFFTGQAAGDNFGWSVSSAGDVNGDDCDDIIVGAPFAQGQGRAYIFFGGQTLNFVPDIILTGENITGGQFGFSVSSAGDVNGDSFDDIIVAAPLTDFSGLDAGTIYIYLGGNPMNGYIDFLNDGYSAGDQLGTCVSKAGDVNGDGFSDLIASAPYNDALGSNTGQANIYFGGLLMDLYPDITLTGEQSEDYFGYSASTAGDVNGDGYADIIVGAPYNDIPGSDGGRSYLFFGAAAMDNAVDVTLNGEAAGDLFGCSVSTAGDVNGDGYSDVTIGACYSDAGGTNSGRAYVFLGGSFVDNFADVIVTGVAASDLFGQSVSAAGDVNGDTFDDVIVGAPYADAGGTDAGRAYVFFGGTTMDNVKDVILTGAAADDRFGWSVSRAGDFNSDGNVDLIVGSIYNDAGGSDAGRAYLYLNSLTGTDIPDEFFTGEAADDQLGYSVSNAGDVNGDSYDDIIVGAPYNNALQIDGGESYIYYGGPGMDNTADVILLPIIGAADIYFGSSVSGAGDLNGDGYEDVVVGAAGTGSYTGTFYIFFGGNPMDGNYDLLSIGEGIGDHLGNSVSVAGDVNGDGYADVIVGAVDNDAGGTSAGRAYIYFGGSLMDNAADLILTGAAAYDYFGYSVSTAGDVNGDGYFDVIVGALYGDLGGADAGSAYIYYGGASMNNTADVIITGEVSVYYFGASVSTAGDVNGDGYADVIVGAVNSTGSSSLGKTYIFYGGTSMNNTADLILTGTGGNDRFGYSVATAGDVNGDGYSDVIVGAWLNDIGGDNAGSAYIYFGSSNMDNLADVTLMGNASGNFLGTSVFTAGDINSDGLSDVIIGANGYGGGFGRAYLYLSSVPPVKPRIMIVKDVPFDQGGQVRLKWVRSSYDVQGINKITDYLIQRSFPPDQNGFAWENIATMPASNEPFYSYVAETPNDSMTNNSGAFYFRITARTNLPVEYWRSNIMSGHSVDNLSPFAPFNFYANLLGDDVKLGWKANTEEDFKDYRIYRSDTPIPLMVAGERLREIDSPDAFTLLGTTTDTTFTDTSAITGTAYYYIQAYDVHDNGSPYSSDSIMAFLSANIRVFLEGSYIGGQMSTFINTLGYIPLTQPFITSPWNYTGTETVTSVPSNVTDWVLVELRTTTTTVVDRRAAFIKNDGTLVDLDGVSNIKFPTAAAGNYYVVIRHRNHLSVMTSSPITISFSPTLYDMRTDLSKAYGTNSMKSMGGGYYGVYTADTDGSGTVNATDRSNTWNQRNLSGYYGTDVDLSGTVNAADRSAVWNNRNLTTQVPAPGDAPITEIVKENNN